MIYLICGQDETNSRQKYDELINSLLLKNPTASQFRVTSENFKTNVFEELTKGQGLFYQKFIVGCDNLLAETKDKQNLAEAVRPWLKSAAASANIFIFLEQRSSEASLVEIKTLAGKVQEFKTNRSFASPALAGFNIFSITEAMAARNKNRAWALYQEALLKGLTPEEIFWKVVWQINNLWLVKITSDLSQLKMNSFVLTRAKAAAKTFSIAELRILSSACLDLYHSTYLGTDEFEFGLEKIILSV